MSPRAFWIVVSLAGCLVGARGAELPGVLRWHRAAGRVDADLQGWPLDRTLQKIAAATGWRVFMEPGLDLKVAARFEGRSEREALSTLLADLNYALIPSAGGPSRLLVFRSVSSQATVAVAPADRAPSRVLEHEVVVRLRRGSRTGIDALAASLGGKVAGRIASLDAHRLVFETAEAAQAARKALEGMEDVAGVESNYALDVPTRMETSREGAPAGSGLRARPMRDESSVIVAMLDTGMPASGIEHSDFLLPSVNITGVNSGLSEGLAHGTAMFETILQGLSMTQHAEGGTPVRVLPVDIYGGGGETSTFQLAQGIVAALEQGADVLNLSLSGPTSSPVVHDLLRQAAEAGVLTFAASGNEPSTLPTFPAAYPEVVAVTAAERPGEVAWYANRGGFIDLIAPGTSVVPYGGENWVVQGTSVSTAYVAGLAAGLLADSGAAPTAILDQMRARLGFQAVPSKP